MYVILTSKPGQFRTEISEGLVPVEAWDYLFSGKRRARFVIAELAGETRIRVIDEAPPPRLNLVPSKFLPKFESVEAARAELAQLTRFGGAEAALQPSPIGVSA